MGETGVLSLFRPCVASWFARRFPDGPTEAQALGWASIAKGKDTLISAPTGSGKTLAAFLVAIDRCLGGGSWSGEPDRPGGTGGPGPPGRAGKTSVLYVSPLKALTIDVRENLETPLAEIAEIAGELGLALPRLCVAVRNGDTPPSARVAMVRDRPEIVVTTPESLYLLLTSDKGRAMLSGVETVIVDEIHALARDKRGAHLALSLERLDRLVLSNPAGPGRRPVRIGCSATQHPIEAIARLLVGTARTSEQPVGRGEPPCEIVDVGHRRALDLEIELPQGELGAVLSNDQLQEVVERLAELVIAHRTTLVFVNTRRMSERIAHLLQGALDTPTAEGRGPGLVAAHHGSLSTRRRTEIEARLRAGSLRAVVATASLELGIDVGPVDLVCQIASPRSIATFIQRVGRADHRRDGVPKGRIFPLTRDELVECVALFAAVRAGTLDAVEPPVAPLDILAQQLVAECASSGPDGALEPELRELVRRAAPYAELDDASFDDVVRLVSDGVQTGRGARGAYLQHDQVNKVLRARRGARLTALTSGGAIPELADYKVVVEPEGVTVGSVHEDFAVEAMVGDVFLLGSTSWRVRHVETGVVRVVDAGGAAPTLPFWLGEAPARTKELSAAVSGLRALVAAELARAGPTAACEAVEATSGAGGRAVEEVVSYLQAALAQLGSLPTQSEIVLERFFDDTGGMQLVLHCPLGARVNRGLGLALRKRFCRTFDFELQAAASDDAVVLSLGPQHSFPLEEVTRYLSPATVRDVLVQALLPTPIFTSRWRWNLSRSLVSPRFRGGRHLPPAIQRMEADDMLAAIFPALAACQENVSGPILAPDHPLVAQTLHDCCTEAIDLDALEQLVGDLRSGVVGARCVETAGPSLLAHEILNGRPYTFLDAAPLEERRTRALSLRRGIPVRPTDLADLDEALVTEIEEEARPSPRDADELADLLSALVLVAPEPAWQQLFATLQATGRAQSVEPRDDPGARWWCATERGREALALVPGAQLVPAIPLPAPVAATPPPTRQEALLLAVRGRIETTGPITAAEIARLLANVGRDGSSSAERGGPQRDDGVDLHRGADERGVEEREVEAALLCLEAEGAVLAVGGARYCARRIAARIRARSAAAERVRHPPVSLQDYLRFLCDWQHVSPDERLAGQAGLAEVAGQLQGYEVAVGSLESGVLASRVSDYRPGLLDELCAAGELAWGRLSPRGSPWLARPTRRTERSASGEPSVRPRPRSGATPSRSTPVALARREDLAWLLAASRAGTILEEPGPGATGEVLEELRRHGAMFFSDLVGATGRLPVALADALWEGVALGRLTSDSFQAVRSLLAGRYRAPGPPRPGAGRYQAAHGPRRTGRGLRPAVAGGRWSLLEAPALTGAPAGTDRAGTDRAATTSAGSTSAGSTSAGARGTLAGGSSGGDAARQVGEELAEAIAGQLLWRWGIVCKDVVQREVFFPSWREVLLALRRFEARGTVRGGRFVAGVAGEQYALGEAVEALRSVSRRPYDGRVIRLSAADPLNLTGALIPGARIPALHDRWISIRDGLLLGEEHNVSDSHGSGPAA